MAPLGEHQDLHRVCFGSPRGNGALSCCLLKLTPRTQRTETHFCSRSRSSPRRRSSQRVLCRRIGLRVGLPRAHRRRRSIMDGHELCAVVRIALRLSHGPFTVEKCSGRQHESDHGMSVRGCRAASSSPVGYAPRGSGTSAIELAESLFASLPNNFVLLLRSLSPLEQNGDCNLAEPADWTHFCPEPGSGCSGRIANVRPPPTSSRSLERNLATSGADSTSSRVDASC